MLKIILCSNFINIFVACVSQIHIIFEYEIMVLNDESHVDIVSISKFGAP